MIRINESIRYQNVVTKKAYFHYNRMKEEIDAFLSMIKQNDVRMMGPLTYALYNVPADENMLVEFIMPVDSDDVQVEGLIFHTYYSVENMVSTYVYGNYEVQMEYAYASLFEFVRKNQLEIITPIFHILDNDRKYIEVKIGCQTK